MNSCKIILLGYMGCGKSEVGGQLAKILNVPFVDLDTYLENEENQSISKIFDSKGELYFRGLERKYLEIILNNPSLMVISLGGGTPCYYNTMDYIVSLEGVTSFYLKTSINSLISRLFNEKEIRPLIAHLENKEDIKDFVGKHLFERNPVYNKAQYKISTDQKSVKTIVEEIKIRLS